MADPAKTMRHRMRVVNWDDMMDLDLCLAVGQHPLRHEQHSTLNRKKKKGTRKLRAAIATPGIARNPKEYA